MTQVKTTSTNGRTTFEDTKRYEHHKLIISVSNYVSEVLINIEELVKSSSNYINLDKMDRTFSILEDGDTVYADKAPAGYYGFRFRKYLPETNGVIVIVDYATSSEFQVIIRDNLTDLDQLTTTITGHIVNY